LIMIFIGNSQVERALDSRPAGSGRATWYPGSFLT
jgi:hypothetical protein